jgi:hypothetical protein
MIGGSQPIQPARSAGAILFLAELGFPQAMRRHSFVAKVSGSHGDQ